MTTPVLIAHRGLIDGPNPEMENRPDVISATLDAGYDAEVDVWYMDAEDEWWLGHDRPTYRVEWQFIIQQPGLWVHCKNLDALFWLQQSTVNSFWHDTDAFTLTSKGFIWTYPGNRLTRMSVCVQPEWDENWRTNVKQIEAYGICSKYVREIQAIRSAS